MWIWCNCVAHMAILVASLAPSIAGSKSVISNAMTLMTTNNFFRVNA